MFNSLPVVLLTIDYQHLLLKEKGYWICIDCVWICFFQDCCMKREILTTLHSTTKFHISFLQLKIMNPYIKFQYQFTNHHYCFFKQNLHGWFLVLLLTINPLVKILVIFSFLVSSLSNTPFKSQHFCLSHISSSFHSLFKNKNMYLCIWLFIT